MENFQKLKKQSFEMRLSVVVEISGKKQIEDLQSSFIGMLFLI
jgi:hypothetical protein